jgi:hypothetical protein
MNGMQVSHYLNYIISLFTCIHSTNIVLSTGQERLILPRGWQAPADQPAVRRRSVHRERVFDLDVVSGKLPLTGLPCVVTIPSYMIT